MDKLSKGGIYVIMYLLMVAIHFAIWKWLDAGPTSIFIRYYIFMTMLFFTVFTVLTLMKSIFPQYIGFAFLGLLFFKLSIILLVMKKLNLSEVPHYKMHFIPPYLISLMIETFYAIHLLKNEKNQ